MISLLSCLAWLTVVLIQALIHFGVIRRAENSVDVVIGGVSPKDLIQNNNNKSEENTSSNNTNSQKDHIDPAAAAAAAAADGAAIADQDALKKTQVGEGRRTDRISSEPAADTHAGTNEIACTKHQKQISFAKPLHQVHQVSLEETACNDMDADADADVDVDVDCDSVEDDEEWRYQLLKDYYDNNTHMHMNMNMNMNLTTSPTNNSEDDDPLEQLEPSEVQTITMLCEELRRKRDGRQVCFDPPITLISSIPPISAQ